MKKRTIWITSAAAAGVLAIGATATAFAVSANDGDDDVTLSTTEIDAAAEAALAEVGAGTVTDIDLDDDATHTYEVDVLLDAGGSVEVKLDRDLKVLSVEDRNDDSRDDRGDGDDRLDDDGRVDDSAAPIDPADRQRAIDAAIAHAGGGTVSEVDLSDDADHVWEVEVQLGNGEDLDVELDANFAVVKAD
jgi:uncharacterized membrane protein YkoI